MLNKYYISERYLLDRESGCLHDLKGTTNPGNEGCGLETMNHPLLFDAKKPPAAGETLKLKTPGGKQTFTIKSRCPRCF